MQACVDVAFPYAHLREAFGKRIGEHQVGFLVISFISPYPVRLLSVTFCFLHFCLAVCLLAAFVLQATCMAVHSNNSNNNNNNSFIYLAFFPHVPNSTFNYRKYTCVLHNAYNNYCELFLFTCACHRFHDYLP